MLMAWCWCCRCAGWRRWGGGGFASASIETLAPLFPRCSSECCICWCVCCRVFGLLCWWRWSDAAWFFLFVADNGPVVGCVGGFRGCRHPRKWRRRCWGEDDGARLDGGGGVVVGEDCGKFLSCCDAAGWHVARMDTAVGLVIAARGSAAADMIKSAGVAMGILYWLGSQVTVSLMRSQCVSIIQHL